MRPLLYSDLELRLAHGSIPMLDATRLELDYVEDLVPSKIRSEGNKQLPPELWNMIIDFASGDDRDHEYHLVKP